MVNKFYYHCEGACSLSTFSVEKRPRIVLANILYMYGREKRTKKKNGSSDLLDLGTFRLIRRSSEESTWSSVLLVLQCN